MNSHESRWSIEVTIALLALVLAVALVRPTHVKAQQQYPVADAIAAKIVAKYQNSTCEQLWMQKSKKTPPTQQEKEIIQILKGDPQMRAAFINKIAAPIANKMFECDMIP